MDQYRQLFSVTGQGATAVTVTEDPHLVDHVWITADRDGEATEVLIDRAAVIALSAALAAWAER